MKEIREASWPSGGAPMSKQETRITSDAEHSSETQEVSKLEVKSMADTVPYHSTSQPSDNKRCNRAYKTDSSVNERTALLQVSQTSVEDEEVSDVELQGPAHLRRRPQRWRRIANKPLDTIRSILHSNAWTWGIIWKELVIQPTSLLPAVFLGLLLNMFDALSYGMILFPPTHPIFSSLGPDGISMFYISTFIAQAAYSFGCSKFCGAVGSQMIEVIPFFHKMALIISTKVDEGNSRSVLATTVFVYAFSSVITGVVFFVMGTFRLGKLTSFFPQHVLVGCIGGVGWFLVSTAIKISTGALGDLTWKEISDGHNTYLWLLPLNLAIVLLALQRYVRCSFLIAGYFAIVTAIFYLVKILAGISMTTLRDHRWLFEAAPEDNHSWYHFYTLYDFKHIDWPAFMATIPTMLALTFFSVLHVPINVPTLGISTGNDDVDSDREFIAHGVSNCLSGLCGSVQNYLVYANSLLFMRCGGNNRLAGLMLAAATFGILVAGIAVSITGYVPVIVVGALIFLLGIELLSEALIYTIGKVHLLEYVTIVVTAITIGVWDFTMGILLGIVLAVLQSLVLIGQCSVIQPGLSGSDIEVASKDSHDELNSRDETKHQIKVLKLRGPLFFGTIPNVENHIRSLLEEKVYNPSSQSLRYLILDMTDVSTIDYSAANVLMRTHRILKKHDVQYVVGGLRTNRKVSNALNRAGFLRDETGIWVYGSMNKALEDCKTHLFTILKAKASVYSSNDQ